MKRLRVSGAFHLIPLRGMILSAIGRMPILCLNGHMDYHKDRFLDMFPFANAMKRYAGIPGDII